jgi:hypothetical protein
MKNFPQLASRIAILSGLALGAFAFSAVAGSWTAAPPNPPNNNADAPINVGGLSQAKTGLLGLVNLVVTNLNVASGTPGIGQVLTSDSSGNASWQAPQGGSVSGGEVDKITAGTANLTISPPSGKGNVTISSYGTVCGSGNSDMQQNWGCSTGTYSSYWNGNGNVWVYAVPGCGTNHLVWTYHTYSNGSDQGIYICVTQ